MTTQNPNPQPTQVYVQHPPSNGLGIAGFVVSLVGLISCGFVSPIGLILSLIGLGKQPRGLAIAGTVIGLLGSLWLAFAGFALVVGAIGIGAAAKAAVDYTAAFTNARQAYVTINNQKVNGDISSSAANAIAQKVIDPWGTPLRAELTNNQLTVTSAGRDKQFGTSDDLSFHEGDLQNTTPPTSRPVFPSRR